MARMIPAFMDERTPPGERDVFDALAAGPEDWVVLHSLDLAPWNRGLRTEIDFVALIPGRGILCIEVKSQEAITFRDDRWYPASISRSPFKQAADGRFTLHRRLREVAPRLAAVPVTHCCVFPRSDFEVRGLITVKPWELVDRRQFLSCRSGHEFCEILSGCLTKSLEADSTVSSMHLNHALIEEFLALCVPVQRFRPDSRAAVMARERDAERALLEQQRPVLRLATLNPRLLVTGPAGSGKTLMALELARRAASSGERVGLLSYNQLIGDWMRSQALSGARSWPNLIVGRAIRIMADFASIAIPPIPTPEFWDYELPDALEERFTAPDLNGLAAFDFVIVDEAQDLLGRPRLWNCLMLLVRGGCAGGRYALFGDFSNQILTNRDATLETLSAVEEAGRPVRWHLHDNCRNYATVGNTALQLCGLPTSTYATYLRRGGTVDSYEIEFYDDDTQQETVLSGWVKALKAKGYRPSEITVLSTRGAEGALAFRLAQKGFPLQAASAKGDQIKYASVHAFKGMESKVVLLTDVDVSDPGFSRDLFYTALTRATEHAWVLCAGSSRKQIREWLS